MYHSSIEEIKGMRVTLFWKSPTGYAIATSFKNTRALKKRNLLKHLIGAVLYSWSTTFWHGTLQFIHKMSGHGHGHGHGCSCEHEHDPAERGLEYGLYQRIDLEKLQCLNESRDGDGKLVFKPWDQRREREKVTAARSGGSAAPSSEVSRSLRAANRPRSSLVLSEQRHVSQKAKYKHYRH